ncbi:TPA: hypothetical protein DCQ44_01330 [Candidatus Taylorbacteria bacterium]|nr:hypothetical protein [Candidatus Taylorbacteria bacterium]
MRYFISLLGLAAIVGAGYFTVAQYVDVAHGQSTLVSDPSLDNTSADGAKVLALLNRLKSINLNGKIFDNPKFTSLQDWSVEIPTQTVGRPNPYLPPSGAVFAAPQASTTPVTVPLPRSTR